MCSSIQSYDRSIHPYRPSNNTFVVVMDRLKQHAYLPTVVTLRCISHTSYISYRPCDIITWLYGIPISNSNESNHFTSSHPSEKYFFVTGWGRTSLSRPNTIIKVDIACHLISNLIHPQIPHYSLTSDDKWVLLYWF